MRHHLAKHNEACSIKDCQSCKINQDFAKDWDAIHRGKKLKEKFGYIKGVWLLHALNFPLTPAKRTNAEG